MSVQEPKHQYFVTVKLTFTSLLESFLIGCILFDAGDTDEANGN